MYEKEKQMPLLSPTEQMWRDDGRQEGRQEGLLEGIEVLLSQRFGDEGLALMPGVKQLTDQTTIVAFLKAVSMTPDLDTLRNMLSKQQHM